jgi:hypothetical protein
MVATMWIGPFDILIESSGERQDEVDLWKQG